MANLKFCESGGDATGDLSPWSGVFGSASISSAQPHTGPNSIKSNGVTGGGAHVQTPTGVLAGTGARVSWYAYFAVLPTGGTSCFGEIVRSGAGLFGIYITTGGVLQLQTSGGVQLGSNGATLTTGVYYRLTISYVLTSTTSYTINAYVNGSLSISATYTGTALSYTNVNQAAFGIVTNPGSGTWSMYTDDVYIDDASDLSDCGDIRVTAKLPTTVNTAGFDTTVGTGAVNERPISTTNGMEATLGTNEDQNYNVQAAGVGDVNITGLTIFGVAYWVYGTSTTGTTQIWANGSKVTGALGTSNGYVVNYASGNTYPSNVAGIGLDAPAGGAAIFLYECGCQIACLFSSLTLKSATDTSSGAAVAFLLAKLAAVDSGSGSAVTSLIAKLMATDTGSGAAVASLLARLTGIDSGVGIAAASLIVKSTVTDSAAGIAAASLLASYAASDSGHGVAAASLLASYAASDSGHGVAAASLITFLRVTDFAYGVDAAFGLMARLGVTGSAQGTDIASLVLKAVMRSGTIAAKNARAGTLAAGHSRDGTIIPAVNRDGTIWPEEG